MNPAESIPATNDPNNGADVAAPAAPAKPEHYYPLKTRLIFLVLALLIPPGIIILFSFEPSENSFFPKCPWHQLTGTHCAGCGTTRALHALFRGNFAQAAAYNLPFLLLMPMFLYWGIAVAVGLLRDRPVATPWTPSRLVAVVFWIMLAFWILRNIPVYPFTLLAPHELGAPPTP